MFKRIIKRIQLSLALQRITLGLSRAGTVSGLRVLDETRPESWEFSGLSQNGEDGIIDYLLGKLNRTNRYFVEIGAADGLENNTAWLAVAKKYSGLMIEGNAVLAAKQRQTIPAFNLGVKCLECFVTKDNIDRVIENMLYRDPDVFSIDIDGNDYHIVKSFLEKGIKPKIIVVEYNSVWGPERAVTIPYQAIFDYQAAHDSGLYYGVSVQAWRKLLESRGYRFITVDTNGVNAFFVDVDCVDATWLHAVRPVEFRENFYQHQKFHRTWEAQVQCIQHLACEEV